MGLVDPYEGGGFPYRPLPRWAVLSFPCDVAGTGSDWTEGSVRRAVLCQEWQAWWDLVPFCHLLEVVVVEVAGCRPGEQPRQMERLCRALSLAPDLAFVA
jgi:hypothetical protein